MDSKDSAHLALLARPELGITFTKLHCWTLTDYTKCVFLDADTLVNYLKTQYELLMMGYFCRSLETVTSFSRGRSFPPLLMPAGRIALTRVFSFSDRPWRLIVNLSSSPSVKEVSMVRERPSIFKQSI